MERDGTRVKEELGPVERARLLQNVVKLWIVKRLYEFVLHSPRHLGSFFSLSFSTRHFIPLPRLFSLSLCLSPLPPSSLLFSPPLPLSFSCSPSPESFSIGTTIFSDSRSIILLLNTKRARILFRESTDFVFSFCSIEKEERRGNVDRIYHLVFIP